MPRLKYPGDLLGTSRAAAYLGLHRSTLAAWRRRGELMPTAIEEGPRGPLYRYSKADLDAFRERVDFDA